MLLVRTHRWCWLLSSYTIYVSSSGYFEALRECGAGMAGVSGVVRQKRPPTRDWAEGRMMEICRLIKLYERELDPVIFKNTTLFRTVFYIV